MITTAAVKGLLRASWGLADGTHVTRHDGGMGSQTWFVRQGGRRWVAKSVAPQLAESFALGLQVARLLDDAGVPSGAPAPSVTGSATVDAPSGDRLALLTWVPGRPLTGAGERQQRLLADTLARAHEVLRGRELAMTWPPPSCTWADRPAPPR